MFKNITFECGKFEAYLCANTVSGECVKDGVYSLCSLWSQVASLEWQMGMWSARIDLKVCLCEWLIIVVKKWLQLVCT